MTQVSILSAHGRALKPFTTRNPLRSACLVSILSAHGRALKRGLIALSHSVSGVSILSAHGRALKQSD